MNLLRRRVLRAASLVLLLGALASPAYAITGSPIITWNPDSGDPDIGGSGISYLRILHHVLVLSGRRFLDPTAPVVSPIVAQRTDSSASRLKR